MVIIQDILISEEVFEEYFSCRLDACKGACCWEGDFGAPLETAEMETLEKVYEDLKPFLSPAGVKVLEEQGLYVYDEEIGEFGTPLLADGACAYLTFGENGIAQCGIEKACRAGAIDFIKPVSCHLYPIRVSKNEEAGFEALNYDRWDICSAACTAGKIEKMPVFRFVKDAIIRKYGEAFFEEMEAMAAYLGKAPE